ncbi:hypothetical protein EHS25_007606 [Saitozyma podzolica]|uniref:Uncharacterized protein n=1 Tax=Saitozyma podzolica TaxID=1890683 RepID=A0A427YQ81_9TREE|nr:hypothetical protein EHS25_007606 [Saitozyma podzolica]
MSQQAIRYLRNEHVCRLEREYEEFDETARSAGLRTAEDRRGNAQIQVLWGLNKLANEWKHEQDTWRESLADKGSVNEDVEVEVDEQTSDFKTSDFEENGGLDDIKKQKDEIEENVDQGDEIKKDEKHQHEKQKDEIKENMEQADEIKVDEKQKNGIKYRHIVPHREFMKALEDSGTLQWMEERWERKKRRMYAEMDGHVDRLIRMTRDKDKYDEEGNRVDTEARM